MQPNRSSAARTACGAGTSVEPLESRTLLNSYFVSPSGSDANPGTSDQPWRTLQYAANIVVAGDTVTARAGAYAGFRLTTDGNPAARITFAAESGVTITQKNPTDDHGIHLDGAYYVTVEGFRVTGVPGAGIRSADNYGVILRNNVADAVGGAGIVASFSEGIVIQGNEAGRSLAGVGIQVLGGADSIIVRGNRVYDNSSYGILLKGDKIAGGGDGIIGEPVIDSNTVLASGSAGGAGLGLFGVRNARVLNNLLYGNYASGITLARSGSTDSPSTDNLIANNTVVTAFDGDYAVDLSGASTGNRLRNNILVSDNAGAGAISIQPDSLAGFTSDYNVAGGGFRVGGTAYTYAEWFAAYGHDGRSPQASKAQLFVSPDTEDFRLPALSPAVDAGETAGAPAVDIVGNVRPHGAGIDIGAFEGVVAAPTVFLQFGNVAYDAPENAGAVLVTVVRTGTPESVSVRYSTADGTAAAGADYAAAANSVLAFAAGEMSKTISIPLIDDAAQEDSETFTLTLGGAVGAAIGASATATLTIRDNDNIATVSLIPDPWNAKKKALFVRGTRAADAIAADLAKGVVTIRSGGAAVGSFKQRQFSRIIVDAAGGDDRVEMPALLSRPVQLSGGDGNDMLVGGKGKDLILGGAGDDQLRGGRGNDMLFGGDGADFLDGGDNNDLLVSGSATFESDAGAMLRLSLAKNSPKAYAGKLKKGAVPPMDATSILADLAPDALAGAGGVDWFFSDGADSLADRAATEKLNL